MQQNIKLPADWLNLLQDEFNKPYFVSIKNFLVQNMEQGKQIFPAPSLIFNALNLTTPQNLKVVILGQDPYHSVELHNGQKVPHAHGLSFSIPKQLKKIPPSLQNIYKELNQDLNFQIPTHGNLEEWAKQGVLLLNSTLTVEAHNPNSHSKIGWQTFTDQIIQSLSSQKENLVFILWGNYARTKQSLIDTQKHFIIQSPHPSPFSAHKGFFGSKPFSKTNQYLASKNIEPINWQIS